MDARISVIEADITTLAVDIIVNAMRPMNPFWAVAAWMARSTGQRDPNSWRSAEGSADAGPARRR